LSIQYLIIANYRPMSTICQHLYTFVEEVYFTRMEGFYLEGVWLLRISGGYSQGKIVTQKNEIVIYFFN